MNGKCFRNRGREVSALIKGIILNLANWFGLALSSLAMQIGVFMERFGICFLVHKNRSFLFQLLGLCNLLRCAFECCFASKERKYYRNQGARNEEPKNTM